MKRFCLLVAGVAGALGIGLARAEDAPPEIRFLERRLDPDWTALGIARDDLDGLDRDGLRTLVARHAGEPPPGTEVFRHREGGLWVRSSPPYLRRLAQVLPQTATSVPTISVRAVLFEVTGWPPPGRDPTRTIALEEILALPADRRRVLSDLQLVTRGGTNAQALDMVELPFLVSAHEPDVGGMGGRMPPPGHTHNTRMIGGELIVTPTLLEQNSRVELAMNWEWTEQVGIIPVAGLGPPGAPFHLPLLGSQRFTTSSGLRFGVPMIVSVGALGADPQPEGVKVVRLLAIRADLGPTSTRTDAELTFKPVPTEEGTP